MSLDLRAGEVFVMSGVEYKLKAVGCDSKTENEHVVYESVTSKKCFSCSMENFLKEYKGRSKMFPMQDGPSLTWSQAEKVYQVYSFLFGSNQSLQTLASRGGLFWTEIGLIWGDFEKHPRNGARRNPQRYFKWNEGK